jgi:pyrroline-5-carboxylate reductase
MRKSLGFIGGGKETRLLLHGFNNRKVKFRRIIVADPNPIVFERLRNDFPNIRAESVSIAASQDIIFLSLDQNMIMDTLGLISNEFEENAIVISLVPDVNFAKLAMRLNNVTRIARVLPSSAAYINEAYIPLSFSPGFPISDKEYVLKLFSHLGKAIEVPEDKLQTYATMAALVPAYFWYQWKELINMGRDLGLTENETVDFLSETVISSLHLNHSSGLSEEQVTDLLPVNPVEENDFEIRETHKRRLIDLYRRFKPELIESSLITGRI